MMISDKKVPNPEIRLRNNLSLVEQRTVDASIRMVISPDTIKEAIFQHSFLCQTYLPYRDPGNHVTIWNPKQRNVNLAIQSTQVLKMEIPMILTPYDRYKVPPLKWVVNERLKIR